MTGAESIVLLPGRGLKCSCGRTAVHFVRCASCTEVHARCGDPKCGDVVRDAKTCCAPPW